MKLIDNINDLWGDDLRQHLGPGARLKIAASAFSIYAFEALKRELGQIDALEFIFTAPTFVADNGAEGGKREHREFHIPKLARERSLYGTEFEIHLRNQLSQRAIAKECADWIRRKAQFRSNASKAFMQQFACIQGPEADTAYMPIQGFTAPDLGYQQGGAVSNFINQFSDKAATTGYLNLFDQIWNDKEKLSDVTEELCQHIESVYRENAPERVYFLMLYNIFSEFLEDLEEEVLPNDRTGYQESVIWKRLFNFQKDAATGIINKLEKYNGCILADSVGLGKTFTALAVIKYYELKNRNVLVLCPKKLAENWQNFKGNYTNNILLKDRLNYDVLCHTDLQRTRGESLGMSLDRINWGNYDLVVIDESHNFRNNDAYKEKETRYQLLMNKVIRQGIKTKVLMLSATPVNNRFNDLRNQLALAYEGDSAQLQAQLKIDRSIEEVFRSAQATFNSWAKLPPEERTPRAILSRLDFDFFELLDSVTIARSRKHIETFYDTADIGKFPKRRKPLSFHQPLTTRTDVMSFNDIYTQLSQLRLSIYAPLDKVFESRRTHYEDLYDTDVEGGRGKLQQKDRERALQSLMTTNLLKRLESSIESFRITLRLLLGNHDAALAKIAAFQTNQAPGTVQDYTDLLEGLEGDDDDFPVPDAEKTSGKVQVRLADMDLPTWRRELQADRDIIAALLADMDKVVPADDAKLQHLQALIAAKIARPINPGNKKVIVFTAFADTATYLYQQLAPALLRDQGLHSALVTGKDAPKNNLKPGHGFQTLLTLFSPRAKEKALVLPHELGEIDLLIATDCISEGQNLQDCDYLINYDIHWNPVRIIQRFGRVDRIGSINAEIQLVNYWPDISLDAYIGLKERVENRMVIADVTATGDDNPLSAQANDVSYRKEQLRRLQDEVIDLEDLKTGVNITDLGLNDFRMDLLHHIRTKENLAQLPHGLHAVVPARPALGLLPGVIFALRNRNPLIDLRQLNRLHPFYLCYMGMDGRLLTGYAEVKQLLDLARAACKGLDSPLLHLCRSFNAETRDGRDMRRYAALLSQAIHTMIEVKADRDIDSLFTSHQTSALRDQIAGLEEFELIAFIVIREEEA